MSLNPEVILGWVLVSVLIGLAAKGMGRSGAAWFLVAIVISPILAGIGLFLVNAIGSPKPATPSTGQGSVADELAKLATLRESGALTPEEFERQKASLLTPR